MKALVLSAGLGTRLKPLTNKMPKAMVPIGNKPLLWHHIQLLKKHGIKDIWINLHWHPQVIKKYFNNGKKYGVKISYSYEKKLLGTSGALKNLESGIEKEFKKSRFIVVYGDNLTNFNYTKLIKFHQKKKALVTEGLYRAEDPWTMGMIETDNNGKIIRAIEKPSKEKITTNQVGAGILICEPAVFNYIPEGISDFGFDIIPKLLKLKKALYALDTENYVQDCGTPERLKKARRTFKSGKLGIPNKS